MAVRYIWSFTLTKYHSGPKLDLNRRYVLKNGLSRALRPSCHSLMKCSFTWDWQCILNSTVLPDIRAPYVCAISFICHLTSTYPKQATNFEDIGPKEHIDDFLSAHLTNPYHGNMAEPKQTGWEWKKPGFFIFTMDGWMWPSTKRVDDIVSNRWVQYFRSLGCLSLKISVWLWDPTPQGGVTTVLQVYWPVHENTENAAVYMICGSARWVIARVR